MSAVCWSVRHLPPSRSLTSFIHSVLCLGSTTSCRSLATRCSRNLAVSTSKEKWLLRKKGSGAQSQGLREDEDEDHADEQSRLLCVRTYQCHGIIFSHPQAFDVFNLTDSRFRSFFCNPDVYRSSFAGVGTHARVADDSDCESSAPSWQKSQGRPPREHTPYCSKESEQ